MRLAPSIFLLLKVLTDTVAIVLALYLAYVLRFDGDVPRQFSEGWAPVFLILVPTRLAGIYIATQYRLRWRFTGLVDAAYVLKSVLLGSALFWLALAILPAPKVPRGVLLLESILTLQFLLVARVVMRVFWNRRRRPRGTSRRVLVVGAGDAGSRVVRDMKEDRASDLQPVAFVDDDPAKRKRLIHGVCVMGDIGDIPALAERLQVDQILIAIPNATGAALTRIVQQCSPVRADLTLLPSLPIMLSSATMTGLIRKVRVEDLLERQAVRVDMEGIAGYTTGERVLVTGAGGSIGKELCRQIASLNPERIIMVGQGENSIFWIEREICEDYGPLATPVIADIKDRVKMEQVFAEFRPTVVFHAAAHKHVPLMEAHPEEAIKNNVFGTRNLAHLAIEHAVKRFVMISTDKAVNPTSVMGASKRLAEMVVQSLAQRDTPERPAGATRFAAVRFGNVLGSRGSVVPSMQQQIERGGPVTVTHPDMVRFFMTIPEAVQLVIQAGAMADSGELFILDMGQPVKIMDLARNLIRLSGFAPDRDIAIKITGIRPGEKLFEEMLTAEEGTTATAHEKIFVARPSVVDRAALSDALDQLRAAVAESDRDRIRRILADTVPSYRCGGSGADPVSAPQALPVNGSAPIGSASEAAEAVARFRVD